MTYSLEDEQVLAREGTWDIPGSEDGNSKEKRRKETVGEQGIGHSTTLIEHHLCATAHRSNLNENR